MNILTKERFEKKIQKTDTCWIWMGNKDSKGYGYCKRSKAHRVSYEYYKGPIPKGMLVCHTCDNPPCVNPEHLWLGTCKDNTQDMWNKNRQYKGLKNQAKGEKQHLAKLNKQQVLEIRSKYIPYKYSSIKLAKEYNVDQSTIWAIITNETWIFP